MPRHIVEVHTFTHTCPGDPTPHIVDTSRAVTDTIHTGHCTNRRIIRSGTHTTAVDCGRVLPAHRRCPACTITIEVRWSTTTDLGEEPTCGSVAPTGTLPEPCPHCGLPVSAVLGDSGRHILCHPGPGGR